MSPRRLNQWKTVPLFSWFCSARPASLCKRIWSDCTSHPLSHSHAHKHTSSPQALCCGGNSAGSDIIMPRPLSNVTERSGNVILGNGQHHNIPAWSNCHYCATTTEAKDLGSNNWENPHKAQMSKNISLHREKVSSFILLSLLCFPKKSCFMIKALSESSPMLNVLDSPGEPLYSFAIISFPSIIYVSKISRATIKQTLWEGGWAIPWYVYPCFERLEILVNSCTYFFSLVD